MDGFRVAEEIRADPGFARTLIVAVTGLAANQDRVQAHNASIDVYLIKPIDTRFVESFVGDARGKRQGLRNKAAITAYLWAQMMIDAGLFPPAERHERARRAQMFTLLADIRAHAKYRKVPILCVLGNLGRVLTEVTIEGWTARSRR